jgi:hypothetical protein
MNNIEIYESPSNILEASTSINNENISLEIIGYSDTSIDILSSSADNVSLSIEQNIDSTIELSTLIATLPSDYIPSVDNRIISLLSGGSGININYDPNIPSVNISATGLQPIGNYELVGHTHQSQDILNFASSVSALIPGISAGSGINIISSGNNYTVAVTGEFGLTGQQVDSRILDLLSAGNNISLNYSNNTNKLTISSSGLQPSGNYSIVGHNHIISEISGLQTSLDSKQPSGSYAPIDSPNFSGLPTVPTATSGSNTNQIANTAFVRAEISSLINSAPSTLDTLNELASALNNDGNFATTVANSLATKASLSGAIFSGSISSPTGNFGLLLQNDIPLSVSGHTHTSTEITNFNSAVSGLLPVKDLLAGSNINIVNNSGQYTINVSGQLGLTAEQVDDRVGLPLNAGSYIQLNYNDDGNQLTIAATGLQPSGNYSTIGHSHSSIDITDFNSATSGLINSLISTNISGGIGIDLAYYSATDTLLVSTSGVSLVGHQHTSSQITDFNSSVSGLLPTLVAGSGININKSGNNLTIAVTGFQPSGNYAALNHSHTSSDITDFNSATSGVISSLLSTNISGGVGIDLLYYSNTDTLSISTSGVSLLGHQHTSSEITDFNTAVRANRLNELTSPSGNVSFNNYRLTNLATAVSGTDAINKNYVDTLYASTSSLGIASFNSDSFSTISGAVSIKTSGIDNTKLVYSYMALGSTTINLGSSTTTINGLTLDGGTP